MPFNAHGIALRAWNEMIRDVKAEDVAVRYQNTQQRFDQDLSNLKTVLRAFRTLKSTEVAKLRRQRNTLLPISRLPVEIMSYVFEKHVAASSVDQRGRLSQLSALLSVCSAWRCIARGTPSIWTTLDTSDAPPFVRMALQNSRTSVISLTGSVSVGGHTNESFLATCRHIPRWRSVDLTAPCASALKPLEYGAALSLKTMVLSCEKLPMMESRPLFLFKGDAPLLQNVAITRINLGWSSQKWQNLRSLKLEEVTGLDLNRFLEILEASPHLHTLALRKISLPESQPRHNPSYECRPLSFLKSLALESIAANTLALLLTELSFPLLETLRLSSTTAPPAEDIEIQIIVAFVLNFLQRNPNNPTVMALRNHEFQVSIQDADLTIGFEGLEEVAEELCRSPKLPVTNLTILECIQGPVSFVMILITLMDRRGITTLTTPLDSDISTPYPDGNWPFPDLQTLIIHDAREDDVLKTVRARKGHYRTRKGEALRPPTLLEKLVLGERCPMDEETFWEIEALLGEGNVVWEGPPQIED